MTTRSMLIISLVWLTACGGDNPPVTAPAEQAAIQVDESARLNAWFAEKNEERLAFSPIELTMLGRKDLYDQIDQMDTAATEAYLAWHAGTIDEMQRDFDYDSLDLDTKTSWDTWIYIYERLSGIHAFAGQDYIFEHMDGMHSFFPTLLINYHKVDTLADMEAYITRIGGVGRAMGQQLELAMQNAELGTRAPRFTYAIVRDEVNKLTSGAPFDDSGNDSPVWADMQEKIAVLASAGTIDAVVADDLLARSRDALVTQFQPAYQALSDWLDRDMANTDPEPRGVWALPDGANYYQQLLRYYTTTNLTPEEIHRIGLAEVERIQAEMEVVKASTDFPGDMSAFMEFVSTDDQFFYSSDDFGRDTYLFETNRYFNRIRERLPEYFGILPKADLVVKRVEAFREQDGAAAHYFPSSPDGSQPGTYYVHMSDMHANSTALMEDTAYHEGIPGHHMQIAIALEAEGIPEFRRQIFYNAYVEGWALYAERLAWEMGAYENPYSNFGRLNNEMWRSVRLVVDTGMHAMGWTREQAVDYFAAHTITPIAKINAEVNRYLVIPGQATSYKIGMLKIMELRGRAEQALGEAFDIREFHDVILGGGALPLDILDRRVDNWIDAKLQI